MNIQANSNKEEIISSACELIDTQAGTISELQTKQKLLFFMIAGLLLMSLF